MEPDYRNAISKLVYSNEMKLRLMPMPRHLAVGEKGVLGEPFPPTELSHEELP